MIKGLTLLTVLLFSASLYAQDPPAPQGMKATLRIAWWSEPQNFPELVLLQEKTQASLMPGVMSFSQKTAYVGPATAVIARKTYGTERDKQGNLPVILTPFASIQLPKDGADLAVLMFPDKTGSSASLQLFDFSEEAFPYGSIQIVNYTNSTLDTVIGSKSLRAQPRQTIRYPGKFEKRQAARFFISATAQGEEPYVVSSSTVIFYPNSRFMFFLMEMPGAPRERRYHDTLIMENRSVTPSQPAEEPTVPQEKTKGKAKAGG